MTTKKKTNTAKLNSFQDFSFLEALYFNYSKEVWNKLYNAIKKINVKIIRSFFVEYPVQTYVVEYESGMKIGLYENGIGMVVFGNKTTLFDMERFRAELHDEGFDLEIKNGALFVI